MRFVIILIKILCMYYVLMNALRGRQSNMVGISKKWSNFGVDPDLDMGFWITFRPTFPSPFRNRGY